ncbi:hypothetical protein AAEX28_06220 [Lentisphaerota bacterium WC36G]|nr:hypothetical protein LJT99_09080 [Lentisphaerae bacterium WC36]
MNNSIKKINYKLRVIDVINILLTSACFGFIIQNFFVIILTHYSQKIDFIAMTVIYSLFSFICGMVAMRTTRIDSQRLSFLANSTVFTASLSLILIQDLQLTLLFRNHSLTEIQVKTLLFLSFTLLFTLNGAFLNLWLRKNKSYYRRGTLLTFCSGMLFGMVIGQIITLYSKFYILLILIFPIAIILSLFYCKKLYARIIQGVFLLLFLVLMSFVLYSFNKLQIINNPNPKTALNFSLAIKGLPPKHQYGLRGLWSIYEKTSDGEKVKKEKNILLNGKFNQSSFRQFQTIMVPLVALLIHDNEKQKVLYYSGCDWVDKLFYLYGVKECLVLKPDKVFAHTSYYEELPKNAKLFFSNGNIFNLRENGFNTVIYSLSNNNSDLNSFEPIELLKRCNDDKFLADDGVLMFKFASEGKNYHKLHKKILKYINDLQLTNYKNLITFNIDNNYYAMILCKKDIKNLPQSTAQLDSLLSEKVDEGRSIPLAGLYAFLLKDSFKVTPLNIKIAKNNAVLPKKSKLFSNGIQNKIFTDNFLNALNLRKIKVKFEFILLSLIAIYLINKAFFKRSFYRLRRFRCLDLGTFHSTVFFTVIASTLFFTNSIFFSINQFIIMLLFGIIFSLLGRSSPTKFYALLSILILCFIPFIFHAYATFINSICMVFLGLTYRRLLLDYFRGHGCFNNILSYFIGLIIGTLLVFAVILSQTCYLYLIIIMFLTYNNEFMQTFSGEHHR